MFQDDPEETQSARSTQSSPQPPHDGEQDKESLWQALHRQNGKIIILIVSTSIDEHCTTRRNLLTIHCLVTLQK